MEKGFVQPLDLHLPAGEARTVPFHFVTPHHSGEFEVEFALLESGRETVLGQSSILVDNKAGWEHLTLTLHSKSESGFAVWMENRGGLPLHLDGFLRVLPEDTANLDLQPVKFTLAPKERTLLHLFRDPGNGEPQGVLLLEGDRQRVFSLTP